MTAELVTLTAKDQRFTSYLTGSFSNTQRAICLKTLNPSTENEVVTFQIIDIPPVNFFKKWSQVLKIHHWVLPTALVFFVLMTAETGSQAWNPVQASISYLALLCWMSAMSLWNDHLDHISGLDRVFDEEQPRPLQRGWITDQNVRRLAFVFLGMGGALGLLVIWQSPLILIFIGASVFLAMWVMSGVRTGLRYRIWMEMSAFLLLGPFLSLGFASAIGLNFNFQIAYLGTLSGIWVLLILQLKNFSRLMVQNQMKQVNTMTWLGFDQGKVFLKGTYFTLLTLSMFYHWIYMDRAWTWGLMIVTIGLQIIFNRVLNRLNSPVSSHFQSGVRSLVTLVYILVGSLGIEYMSHLLVMTL